MSRSKREKNPDPRCLAENDSRDPSCPHLCQLPYQHEGDHFCCSTNGGTFSDDDLYKEKKT